MDLSWASKKLGPFPTGVYVAVGGVGLGFVIMRSRQKAAAIAAQPAPVQYPLTVPADGSLYNNAAPSPSTTVVDAPRTNSEWVARAQTVLIGKGFQPTVAGNALAKYIAGKTLTTQEQALIDVALTSVGPAPVPPIPSALPSSGANMFGPGGTFEPQLGVQPGGSPPANATPAELAAWRTNTGLFPQGPVTGNRGFYTVRQGDTPDSIATFIYGPGFSYRWKDIEAMNPNRNLLIPGTIILVPW